MLLHDGDACKASYKACKYAIAAESVDATSAVELGSRRQQPGPSVSASASMACSKMHALSHVQALMQEYAERQVQGWEKIKHFLMDQDPPLAWSQRIRPGLLGVHPKNRAGGLADPSRAHELGRKIAAQGFIWSKTVQSTCFCVHSSTVSHMADVNFAALPNLPILVCDMIVSQIVHPKRLMDHVFRSSAFSDVLCCFRAPWLLTLLRAAMVSCRQSSSCCTLL